MKLGADLLSYLCSVFSSLGPLLSLGVNYGTTCSVFYTIHATPTHPFLTNLQPMILITDMEGLLWFCIDQLCLILLVVFASVLETLVHTTHEATNVRLKVD